jgi:hypothetical protein
MRIALTAGNLNMTGVKMDRIILMLLLAIVSNVVSATAQKVSTKESYQESYCLKYGMAEDTVDVETIFEEMDASPFPYSMVEFWTAPVCRAPQKLDSKVPMIFNTAENVHQAENFPKAIREYLLEVKHDSATWLKIINSKSSDGLTFLDYMYYSINHNMYTIQETKDAAQRIVNYICKNGGLYSKYKDDVKCQ